MEGTYHESIVGARGGKKIFICYFYKLITNFLSFLFLRVDNQLTTSISGRLEGPNLTVCVDCKEMILQVIRAQSTARRIKMAKSLFDEGGEIQHNEALVNSDVWGEEFF